MPQLSIIVPVYNTKEYLTKCVESVITQTCSICELILTNDGSADESGEICDECASKDNRVIVIHQKNLGVSAARNSGLDIATGEYIGFVDSDDWIDRNTYSCMIDTAKRTNSEIVSCDIVPVEINGCINYKTERSGEIKVFSRNKAIKDIISMPGELLGFVINKIYYKEIIKNVRFNQSISMGEDWLFNYESIKRAEKICRVIEPLYFYVQRAGSAMNSKEIYKTIESVRTCQLEYELVSKDFPELKQKAFEKMINDTFRFLSVIDKSHRKNSDEITSILRRVRRELICIGLTGKLSVKKCCAYIIWTLKY